MQNLKLDRGELVSGGLIILIGAFIAWEASGYPRGSLDNIGPGFFPMILGLLLVALGAGICFGRRPGTEELPEFRLRPVLAVAGAIMAWALLAERFGIVPATIALALIASLAGRQAHPGAAVATALGLAIGGSLLFVKALGIPLPHVGW